MLFGSTVVETAIGLVLVYLLLSLICSAIQELLAQLLALRSKTLSQGIETMLTPDLAQQLYDHPLINTQYRQGRFDRLVGRTGKPSYISAETFAITLIDVLQTNHTAVSSQSTQAPSSVPGSNPLPAGAGTVSTGSPKPDPVREAIVGIPEERVRRVLLLLLDNVEGDYHRFTLSLTHWYDDTMNRVSGWYKRKVQILLLIIGLVLTVALGVDTISAATALWKEPTLRAQVVAVAQQTVKQTAGTQSTNLIELNRQLNALQLPMGWANSPADAGAWVIKLLGLLLTSIAVSLGAPFWFGVLNKIVNIRAAGPSPAEVPTSQQV
jgi:hypothetical protein